MTYCDCVTADDAMAKARAVALRRRTVFGPAKVQPPKYVPEPVNHMPHVQFEILVQRAYPLEYPDSGLPRRSITIREILNRVAAAFDYRWIDIISARRTLVLITPRHLVMALACELTSLSTPSIGRFMGGRDHTTILHARDKMKPLIDEARKTAGVSNDLDTWIWECRRLLPTVKLADYQRKYR